MSTPIAFAMGDSLATAVHASRIDDTT
jgi:hypothetical protein